MQIVNPDISANPATSPVLQEGSVIDVAVNVFQIALMNIATLSVDVIL